MDEHNLEFEVELVSQRKPPIGGKFILIDPDPSDRNLVRLILQFEGTELVASAADYFNCLCTIRMELEHDGLIPYCYGASKNVYPSGMALEMSTGLVCYKLVIGKSAAMKDTINTFQSGPDIEPVSVAEQEAYFEEWVKGPFSSES